jgi:hypothetical protein
MLSHSYVHAMLLGAYSDSFRLGKPSPLVVTDFPSFDPETSRVRLHVNFLRTNLCDRLHSAKSDLPVEHPMMFDASKCVYTFA